MGETINTFESVRPYSLEERAENCYNNIRETETAILESDPTSLYRATKDWEEYLAYKLAIAREGGGLQEANTAALFFKEPRRATIEEITFLTEDIENIPEGNDVKLFLRIIGNRQMIRNLKLIGSELQKRASK